METKENKNCKKRLTNEQKCSKIHNVAAVTC